MDKNIYLNKKTGQRVVTSEVLDKKHYTAIYERKTGQMNKKKIKTK
jgi:hypothetical protein